MRGAGNVIAFPGERVVTRCAGSREQLKAFFLGQRCRHASGEAAVMAWLKALPASRCHRRAAWAMRVHLAQVRLNAGARPGIGAPAWTADLPGQDLRQRQVLAFLGAISRHRCACRQCGQDGSPPPP